MKNFEPDLKFTFELNLLLVIKFKLKNLQSQLFNRSKGF